VVRWAAAVALAVVVLAPELVLWRALVPFSRADLALSDGWEFFPPLMFGAAGAACALLALRAVLAGRAAVVERVLTFVYALSGAAVASWYEAHAHRLAAAVVFAGAALSAPLLWDRVLRHLAWQWLDRAGVIERPLPRFRVLRWVFDFQTTRTAWLLALREGIYRPDEALAALRARQAVERVRQDGIPELEPLPELGEPLPELAELTKADALRTAWKALGVDSPDQADVKPAVAWLASRGVEVNESYAYTVSRRVAAALAAGRRAQITSVAGGESR
jgi:hypothetical protein